MINAGKFNLLEVSMKQAEVDIQLFCVNLHTDLAAVDTKATSVQNVVSAFRGLEYRVWLGRVEISGVLNVGCHRSRTDPFRTRWQQKKMIRQLTMGVVVWIRRVCHSPTHSHPKKENTLHRGRAQIKLADSQGGGKNTGSGRNECAGWESVVFNEGLGRH